MYSRKVARDSLFFSTKAGFIDSLTMQDLLSKGKISQSDIAGGINCIHPACLEVSLDNSLRDMHVDTVSLIPYAFQMYENECLLFWWQESLLPNKVVAMSLPEFISEIT